MDRHIIGVPLDADVVGIACKEPAMLPSTARPQHLIPNIPTMRHFAVFGADLSLSSPFIQDLIQGNSPLYFPEIQGKKGALFSGVSLAGFMEEEMRHDRFDLTEQVHRSIR